MSRADEKPRVGIGVEAPVRVPLHLIPCLHADGHGSSRTAVACTSHGDLEIIPVLLRVEGSSIQDQVGLGTDEARLVVGVVVDAIMDALAIVGDLAVLGTRHDEPQLTRRDGRVRRR